MKLDDEQHNELLALIEELKGYVQSGYANPTDIWDTPLARMTEILWSIVETGGK